MEEAKQLRREPGRAVALVILLGTDCLWRIVFLNITAPTTTGDGYLGDGDQQPSRCTSRNESRFRCDGEGYGPVQYVGYLVRQRRQRRGMRQTAPSWAVSTSAGYLTQHQPGHNNRYQR